MSLFYILNVNLFCLLPDDGEYHCTCGEDVLLPHQNRMRDGTMAFRAKTSHRTLLHSFYDSIMCSINCCYNDRYGCCCKHSSAASRAFDCLLVLNSSPRGTPFLCLVTQGTRFCPLFEFLNEPRLRRCGSTYDASSELRHDFERSCSLCLPESDAPQLDSVLGGLKLTSSSGPSTPSI